MNVRILSTFMALWLGFAFVGGLVDGVILSGYDASDPAASTGDAGALAGASKLSIQTQEKEGILGNLLGQVTRWFAASYNFLSSWANMLALNFSFFTGPYVVVGWLVRGIIGVPMVTMLLLHVLGRA